MKRYLLVAGLATMLAGCLNDPAAAAPTPIATTCTAPDPLQLRAAWQGFRSATLAGHPDLAAKYYKFPVQLLGPMDNEKPLVVSRRAFIKNYRELFQQGPAGNEIGLLTALKKTKGNENLPSMFFNMQACRYATSTRVLEYNFVYDRKAGWQIDSVYYGEDYPIAKDAGLDQVAR